MSETIGIYEAGPIGSVRTIARQSLSLPTIMFGLGLGLFLATRSPQGFPAHAWLFPASLAATFVGGFRGLLSRHAVLLLRPCTRPTRKTL